jgi:hypothetical protein
VYGLLNKGNYSALYLHESHKRTERIILLCSFVHTVRYRLDNRNPVVTISSDRVSHITGEHCSYCQETWKHNARALPPPTPTANSFHFVAILQVASVSCKRHVHRHMTCMGSSKVILKHKNHALVCGVMRAKAVLKTLI